MLSHVEHVWVKSSRVANYGNWLCYHLFLVDLKQNGNVFLWPFLLLSRLQLNAFLKPNVAHYPMKLDVLIKYRISLGMIFLAFVVFIIYTVGM